MSHDLATTHHAPAVPAALRPSLFRHAVLDAFAGMKLGRLRLELPDGSIREFGEAGAAARSVAPGVSNTAFLRVRRMSFFTRCALYGDIGFAEAYIDGDWRRPTSPPCSAGFCSTWRTPRP